jgi:hypothetical protein
MMRSAKVFWIGLFIILPLGIRVALAVTLVPFVPPPMKVTLAPFVGMTFTAQGHIAKFWSSGNMESYKSNSECGGLFVRDSDQKAFEVVISKSNLGPEDPSGIRQDDSHAYIYFAHLTMACETLQTAASSQAATFVSGRIRRLGNPDTGSLGSLQVESISLASETASAVEASEAASLCTASQPCTAEGPVVKFKAGIPGLDLRSLYSNDADWFCEVVVAVTMPTGETKKVTGKDSFNVEAMDLYELRLGHPTDTHRALQTHLQLCSGLLTGLVSGQPLRMTGTGAGGWITTITNVDQTGSGNANYPSAF